LKNDQAIMLDRAVDWQMVLNTGKCKCLHIGCINSNHTYEMGGGAINRCGQEKDLGPRVGNLIKVRAKQQHGD
ncbi:hypothetical protein CAPTEDRAFT_101986, partial [Capitella teleta]